MAGFHNVNTLGGHAMRIASDDASFKRDIGRPCEFDGARHAGCSLTGTNDEGFPAGW